MKALSLVVAVLLGACGGSTGGSGDGGPGDGDGGPGADAGDRPDATPPVPQFTELWYSVDDLLVRIELDASNGQVVAFTPSTLGDGMEVGQNLITMLDDGSLLIGRLSRGEPQRTHFWHLADPPRDGGAVSPVSLGLMPDDLMLEGLYTDCDGRVYGMDTGADDSSAAGNRLLRFTGDVRTGDFSYVVVSDLATASVADIDDMGPAIVANEIVDNPGLAIDSGTVHAFDFETGSGTAVGTGGTWGIHALGRELFTDGQARLYLLSSTAELYQMDPVTHVLSPGLGTGPTPGEGAAGWSGLAGPLTACDSGFEID
jgi:hypothetical protein